MAASGRGSISDATVALEGDAIYCPACKSNGKILCIATRIDEHLSGIKIGRSGDLCACGCRPLPRLSAVQTVRYQTPNDCHQATPTIIGPAQPQAHQTSSEKTDALAIRSGASACSETISSGCCSYSWTLVTPPLVRKQASQAVTPNKKVAFQSIQTMEC
ncbi:PAAR domain-containing protein [Pseudoduganella danionis]|uniref:PAAR domain-containing protein n=1 Tax=Pseudoduganella danionis TaxID=1890295 RepID=UPI0035AF6BB8